MADKLTVIVCLWLTLIPVHSGLAFSILYGLIKSETQSWVERTTMTTNGAEFHIVTTVAMDKTAVPTAQTAIASNETSEAFHTSDVFNLQPFWQSSTKSIKVNGKTVRTTRKSFFFIPLIQKKEVIDE